MQDLPMGLGMALAQNPDAMEYFCSLPEQEQQSIIDHTHSIQSRREMHDFVQSFGASH